MTNEDLKSHLSAILAHEEAKDVDWSKVELLCQSLRRLLNDEGPADHPSVVDEYLSSVRQRREDPVFAHAQRTKLLSFLRS